MFHVVGLMCVNLVACFRLRWVEEVEEQGGNGGSGVGVIVPMVVKKGFKCGSGGK